MLFPYTAISHSMDRMQEFIEFIVLEVWCKADTSTPFGLELFDGCPDLKTVMTAFAYSDTKGGDAFYTGVEKNYAHFAELTPPQIAKFRHWFVCNNDIENACANSPTNELVRYSDLDASFPTISTDLKQFFKSLYSKDLLELAALKPFIGNIGDHYNTLMSGSRLKKCPFCGLTDLLSEHHGPRDAYDHFLPKAIYPFNSINFKNLAPACHHCNSSYKTTKDPTFTPKDKLLGTNRRKAFFPYSATAQQIELGIKLKHADLEKLKPDDVELEFGPAELSEEIETWKDVYGIEERFRAKLCDDDAKEWIEQYRIIHRKNQMTPIEFKETIDEQCGISPFTNFNFLKKPFVGAGFDSGILQAIADGAPS